MPEQLFAIFAFGVVITGIVVLGLVRANSIEERRDKVQAAHDDG